MKVIFLRDLIETELAGVPFFDDAKYFVRCMLVRDNPSFRRFPVDQVCKNHSVPGDEFGKHVLRLSDG